MGAMLNMKRVETISDGDKEFERQLFTLFMQTLHTQVAELESLTASGGKAWSAAAHTLKGAAINIGADQLAEMALSAENMGEASAETRKDFILRLKEHQGALASLLGG